MTATPLVLIPGNLQKAAHWLEFGYVGAFPNAYHVLAIDPLGHGLSDKPRDANSYAPADVAADVIAVLDAEGIATANLWGHSRGAAIAVNVAMLFPDRVANVILGGYQFGALPDPGARETVRQRVDALRRGDWQAFFDRVMEAFPEFGDPAIAGWFRGDNDPVVGAAVMGGALVGERVSLDLSRFRDRTLVYVGSEESWLQPEGARDQLRKRCADAGVSLDVIEGVGHLQSFTQAGRVIPLVRRHLDVAGLP